MNAPLGYCPDCGKLGIKDEGGVVTCSNGHTYKHFEAVFHDQGKKDAIKTEKTENVWETETTKKVALPKTTPVQPPPKVTEADLISLAKNVQQSNQRIEQGFKKIHKALKDLLEEVEGFLD